MAKRITFSPTRKPFWKTCTMVLSPRLSSAGVHRRVVQVGIKGVSRRAEALGAQALENLLQLRHGHLHALFVGGVFRGLVQRALQIVVDGKHLRYGVGLAVAVGLLLFLRGALAEIIIFRCQTQPGVMLGIVFFLPGVGILLLRFLGSLLLRGFLHRFLRCFLRGLLLYFFFFLLCHVCDLLSICRVGENLAFAVRGFSPALPV
mgnify:CR=1 FL=1